MYTNPRQTSLHVEPLRVDSLMTELTSMHHYNLITTLSQSNYSSPIYAQKTIMIIENTCSCRTHIPGNANAVADYLLPIQLKLPDRMPLSEVFHLLKYEDEMPGGLSNEIPEKEARVHVSLLTATLSPPSAPPVVKKSTRTKNTASSCQ